MFLKMINSLVVDVRNLLKCIETNISKFVDRSKIIEEWVISSGQREKQYFENL